MILAYHVIESSFVRDVQILTQNLVHRKHVHLVLFEDRSQSIITANHALVIWVLEVICTHVGPNALDRLWPR